MAEKLATAKIRIGPAGWSYKDWIGIVYLNGALLEPQKENNSGVDTSVAKPLADLDVICLGPGMVNIFLFLIIPKR